MSTHVSVFFLGGLGEIGRNMTVIEGHSSVLVIDCGLMFPDSHMLGIKKVRPYLNYFESLQKPVEAILITHGHEDHVGGLVDLLQLTQAPLFGSRLSLAIAKEKLRHRSMWRQTSFTPIEPGTELSFSEFSITPFPVVHSIPESFGYAIKHDQGTIVHTGDFKFDRSEKSHAVTESMLNTLGNDGVDVLLSDSTNALQSGWSPDESDLTEPLVERLSTIPGKIITTMFSSNIRRALHLCDIAEKLNRKVLVLGTSLINMLKISEELGLSQPIQNRLSYTHAKDMDDSDLFIITTGSQGEPHSVLSQAAYSRYKDLALTSEDCIVMSSKTIPGNERNVNRLMNKIAEIGAQVLDGSRVQTHVSGHGYESDLACMIGYLKPKHFVPIHGEYKHLKRHAEIAASCGLTENQISILKNGQGLSVPNMSVIYRSSREATLVDGLQLYHDDDPIFDERTQLQKHGYLSVSLVIAPSKPGAENTPGSPAPTCTVESSGFLPYHHPFFDAIGPFVEQTARKCMKLDEQAMLTHMKDALNQWVFEQTKKRPNISLHIHWVS